MQIVVKILIKEIFNGCLEWDQNKDYYLNNLIPDLIKNPSMGMQNEKEIIERIKEIIPEFKYRELFNNVLEIYSGPYKLSEVIATFIQKGDFRSADEIFNQVKNLHFNSLSFHDYEKKKELHREKIRLRLNQLIDTNQDREAQKLFSENNDILPDYNYTDHVRTHQKSKLRAKVRKNLEKLLHNNNYSEADNYYQEYSTIVTDQEYEDIKSKFIRSDLDELSKKIGLSFDPEKANALAKTGQFIMVQARAGSGKTTVVALKVRQLINCYGIKPEEVMVLAFNKKAAVEFKNRINNYCQHEIVDNSNSSTFHSLAYRLVNPGAQLLFNDSTSGSEFVTGRQSQFIGQIYNTILNHDREAILKLLYTFFRATAREKRKKEFKNHRDYYLYRRNLQYVSLAGDRVKSKAEKYIADFLFEHTILKNNSAVEYKYEWNLPGERRGYKPDFSFWIQGHTNSDTLIAILEYFGVTKKNPASRDYMSKDEEKKYIQEKEWKRHYAGQNKIIFLETSVDDFDTMDEHSEREDFEMKLKKRFEENGFVLQRLSRSEVIKKMLKAQKNLDPFFDKITSFINRAKKQQLSPPNLQDLFEKRLGGLGERTESFLQIAIRVYKEYETQLVQENNIDFDDLLTQAIEKIEQTQGNCTLEILGKKCSVKNIKSILIDEYQDFSKLFYKLIDAIIHVNSTVKVFCVGDDWQAINGFAGSDLEYFSNFNTYYPRSNQTSLRINHRSNTRIIEFSNLIMQGCGDGGLPEDNRQPGIVELQEIPFVEWRVQPEFQKAYMSDEIFRNRVAVLKCWKNKEMEISRYLKAFHEIIVHNVQADICLLFRTNMLYGVRLEPFESLLHEWYPHTSIKCSTAHRYKGQESDIVVVVDANRSNYPKIHPDNDLMEILGVTFTQVVEEERRLFYVAATRAKEKLYLLYESDLGYSDFIPNTFYNSHSTMNMGINFKKN